MLVIHNITRFCGGTYECVAENGVPPSVRKDITVKVQCETLAENYSVIKILAKKYSVIKTLADIYSVLDTDRYSMINTLSDIYSMIKTLSDIYSLLDTC